jgi:hypothetical protein
MITKIRERLLTGTIKNVIVFGDTTLPAPPYIVIRPEQSITGRAFRIITHMSPGQNIWLEDYTFNELSLLLKDYKLLSRHGNTNKLFDGGEYTDIINNNDDGTISMERVFQMPTRLF